VGEKQNIAYRALSNGVDFIYKKKFKPGNTANTKRFDSNDYCIWSGCNECVSGQEGGHITVQKITNIL